MKDRILQWCIRLIKKDMYNYEVEKKEKDQLYLEVKKQYKKKRTKERA